MRDQGAFEATVAMPQAAFGGQYLHEDLPAMAAAYFFHIVKNHPFEDGNKRTDLGALVVFLDLNEFTITADDDVLIDLTLAVAQSQITKAQPTQQLRAMAVPKGNLESERS